MPVSIALDNASDVVNATMLNISSSGTAVVVVDRQLVGLGDTFLIEFDAACSGLHLSLPCKLCYVLGNNHASLEKPKWLHGASFAQLSVEASLFIDTYVRERLTTQNANIH